MLRKLKGYVIITLGCAVAGFAIACFLLPSRLAAGGLSGIATIINHFFGFPVGIAVLVMNVPILWIGVRTEGKIFGIKTCYGALMYSVFIDLFSRLPQITEDYILSSLYGGILLGVGMGLVFYANATTGGIDIVAKLVVKKYPYYSVGKAMLALDIMIILSASVLFKSMYTGLYSIIALYVSSTVMDSIIEGVDFAKTVIIITERHGEIAERIMQTLDRGVTGIYGRGMYTGRDKTILLCTVRKNQIPTLKRIVAGLDENAFIITSDSREVVGEGFRHEKI